MEGGLYNVPYPSLCPCHLLCFSARRLWALYSWRQGVAVVALGESAGKRLRQAVDETAARSR